MFSVLNAPDGWNLPSEKVGEVHILAIDWSKATLNAPGVISLTSLEPVPNLSISLPESLITSWVVIYV